MLHYHCVTFYINKTAKERVPGTTEFSPEILTLPRISSKDATTNAYADLTHALLNPTTTRLLTMFGDKKIAALKKLTKILNMIDPTQVTPHPRVNTPEATPEAAVAPPTRVDPQDYI